MSSLKEYRTYAQYAHTHSGRPTGETKTNGPGAETQLCLARKERLLEIKLHEEANQIVTKKAHLMCCVPMRRN